MPRKIDRAAWQEGIIRELSIRDPKFDVLDFLQPTLDLSRYLIGTPIDGIGVAWLNGSQGPTAANLTQFIVPDDRIAIITAAGFSIQAGATAPTTIQLLMTIRGPGGTVLREIVAHEGIIAGAPLAANAVQTLVSHGVSIAYPGQAIQWDLGTTGVGSTLGFNVHFNGFHFPRGVWPMR